MLRIERIKLEGDRWTAELTFAPVAFDPDYWLSRTAGFLVDSPEGEVGVVDEVVRTAEGDVGFLAVAGGWFGRRRHLIATRDIEEIHPGSQRLLVRAAAAPAERSRRVRRFPLNLVERATSRLEPRDSESPTDRRRVEIGPEDEVVLELFGVDGRRSAAG
jgi:hypothetical protein